MNEQKQAQLLEQYLAMLRQSPGAPAPAELDPVMAELARKIAQQSASDAPQGVKARVWQQVMAGARSHNNTPNTPINAPTPGNIIPLTAAQNRAGTTHPHRKTLRLPVSLTLAAAMAAFIAIAAALLPFVTRDNGSSDQFGSGGDSTRTAMTTREPVSSSTPFPTPEMTATPFTQAEPTASQTPAQPITSTPMTGTTITLGTMLPPTMTGIDIAPITSTPLAVQPNALMVTRGQVGQRIVGQITDRIPMAIYEFTMPADGVVVANVNTTEFKPQAFYTVVLADPAAPAITNYAGAVPTAVPPVPEGTMGDVLMVTPADNLVWFAGNQGDQFLLHVSSVGGQNFGVFEVETELIKPVMLSVGSIQAFQFNPETSVGYFRFDNTTGDIANLMVQGVPIYSMNSYLFDVARPAQTLMAFKLPSTNISPALISSGVGSYGLILEPIDPTQSGEITLSLSLQR